MTTITINKGSLLDSKADTIVNPANSFLQHSGGLAKIIDKTAQGVNYGAHYTALEDTQAREPYRTDHLKVARYLREHAEHSLIPTGGAGWTSAGRLPYKGIVHAVGPIWGGGHLCEGDLLELAHESALLVAGEHGCTSVAFPAISAGVFGVPIRVVAWHALGAADVLAGEHGVERVEFWLMDDAHIEAFRYAAGVLDIAA